MRTLIGVTCSALVLTVGAACDTGTADGDRAAPAGTAVSRPSSPAPDQSGPGAATTDPSPTAPTRPPSVGPPRRVLDLGPRRLPHGPPPGVSFIYGTTVIHPDGVRVPLERPFPDTPCCDQPGLRYHAFARYASGWLTLTSSDTPEVYAHGPDGRVQEEILGSQLAGSSHDGQWALVGGPRAFGPGGAVLRWPGKGDGTAAGFVGDREVVFNGRRDVYVGRPDGSVRAVAGWEEAFAATSAGRLAVGQTRGGHRGVFTVPSGREVLDVQRLDPPFSFDPTGRWVVGSDARCLCGLLVTRVSTGRTVLALKGVSFPDQPPYWEDERHLLVLPGYQTGSPAVLRVGLDGTVEVALRGKGWRRNFTLPLPTA